jgi:hypothetical protein
MWSKRVESKSAGRVMKIHLERESSPVSYSEVLRRWQTDAEFRTFFIALLAETPYEAFRWETPPITTANVTRSFEFVVLDSPGLARKPDQQAFAEHFDRRDPAETVVTFKNLGGDAILVVPCRCTAKSCYGHLATFLREAPEAQRHELWQRVGAAVEQRLGPKSLWISTAGAGVSWLHVRLDDRPKYYGYAAYRKFK